MGSGSLVDFGKIALRSLGLRQDLAEPHGTEELLCAGDLSRCLTEQAHDSLPGVNPSYQVSR